MMISAIGIDPGNPAGVALVMGDEVFWDQLPNDGNAMAGWLESHTYPWVRDFVGAVEGQFIPRLGGQGQAERYKAVSIIKTAHSAGAWRALLDLVGCQIIDEPGKIGVLASTWRRAMGGPRGGRLSARQWSLWAREQVKLRYGLDLQASQEHAADAILIATWAIGEYRVRERMK